MSSIDFNIYNYNQTTQNVSGYGSTVNAASKAAEQNEQKVSSVDQTTQTETDRAEFSKDTVVTTKMSDADRAALVKSLKADLENQTNRFVNMMTQMFQKQGITGFTAQDDSFWQLIASGNYQVDAQTKAEAQEAISEDGYWGVKQTSQRIFDFAYALAGDDVDKMKEMQAAVEKGFEAATKSWGRALPSISDETHSAINDLFNDFYARTEQNADE